MSRGAESVVGADVARALLQAERVGGVQAGSGLAGWVIGDGLRCWLRTWPGNTSSSVEVLVPSAACPPHPKSVRSKRYASLEAAMSHAHQ